MKSLGQECGWHNSKEASVTVGWSQCRGSVKVENRAGDGIGEATGKGGGDWGFKSECSGESP